MGIEEEIKFECMIQANELRIGNWVYVTDEVLVGDEFKENFIARVQTIKGLGSLSVDGGRSDISLRHVDPIPLTPEILQKCGMTKDNYWENCYLFTENEGMFSFEWKNDALVMYVGNTLEYESGPDVKYLHQLQNLYFALTGEELNIEL
jgi:hypothetical protein